MEQTTNTVLMLRPVNFRMNEQTVINNYYQSTLNSVLPETVNAKAQKEFDDFVDILKSCGVHVIVVQDTKETDTPDAVFPNNWVSFHENGMVAIYPMFAENRRLERREDILEIVENHGFKITDVMDYTSAEESHVFLEGTGSVVLDRVNRKAYCALSSRSDEDLFIEFCEDFEYAPVIFVANQTVNGKRLPIYHTNVMMSIGETFAVICLDAIDETSERKNVLNHLKKDGKEVIAITEQQMTGFAGNMLQVKGEKNNRYLVMSATAYNSLTSVQMETLKKHNKALIKSNLETIEACGGGSARCMMAEIFLPKA